MMVNEEFEQVLGGKVLAWVGAAAVVAGFVLLYAMGIKQGWIGEGARTLIAAGVSLALLMAGVLAARAPRPPAGGARCCRHRHLRPVHGRDGCKRRLRPRAHARRPRPGVRHRALATVLALRWESPLMGALGIAGAVSAPVLVGAPSTTTTIVFEAVAVASAVARPDPRALGLAAADGDRAERPAVARVAVSTRSPRSRSSPSRSCSASSTPPLRSGSSCARRSSRLRLASIGVVALNALMLGVAGWMRLKGLGHDELALMWLAFLACAHLTAGFAAQRSKRITSDLALTCFTLAVLLADVAFALTVMARCGRSASRPAGRHGAARPPPPRRRRRPRAVRPRWPHRRLGPAGPARREHVPPGELSSEAAVIALVAVAGRLPALRPPVRGRAHGVALRPRHDRPRGAGRRRGDDPRRRGRWRSPSRHRPSRWRRSVPAAMTSSRRPGSILHLLLAGFYALCGWCLPSGVAGDLGGGGPRRRRGRRRNGGMRFVWRRGEPARRILALAAPVVALYVASVVVASLGTGRAGAAAAERAVERDGVAALVVGLRRRDAAVRVGAWALLALAAGKVFLYDLAALDSVYRVGSFMALGLLLLIGALAYQGMRPALTCVRPRSRSASRRMPSPSAASAAAAKSVGRSVEPLDGHLLQGRHVAEVAQLVRLPVQRGADARRLAQRVLDRRVERPVLAQQVARGLLADALRARDAVGRVARSAMKSGTCSGRSRSAPAPPRRRRTRVHPWTRLREQDRDVVADALEHVAVAREQQRAAAGCDLAAARLPSRSSASSSPALSTDQPNAPKNVGAWSHCHASSAGIGGRSAW
jgi:hypothetical protein